MAEEDPLAREDPLVGFKFSVEVKGIIEGSFLECSGLTIQREQGDKLTIKEGGLNDAVHRLPGRLQYSNITLKHGVTSSTVLWDWFLEGAADGKVKRTDVSILQLDQTGKEVKRWNLSGAFPIKWTGPDLKSDSNQVMIESLEITYNRLSFGD